MSHRRYTEQGELLPLVGMIVDGPLGVDLHDSVVCQVSVGSMTVEVVEGVLDQRWHVAVVRRHLPSATTLDLDDSSRIEALRKIGVRQVFSAAVAIFDLDSFMSGMFLTGTRAVDFIDLSGAPEWSAGVDASSCPRLRSAMGIAAEHEAFELLEDDLQRHLFSVTEAERAAAMAYGMCFAALDVLSPLVDDANELQTRMGRALVRAPEELSPLSSCSCAQTKISPAPKQESKRKPDNG